MFRMKTISNILKIIVGLFILYQYWSNARNGVIMDSDQCKGLLYIAIASFCILCPVDASIFLKNFKEVKHTSEEIKQDIHKEE